MCWCIAISVKKLSIRDVLFRQVSHGARPSGKNRRASKKESSSEK